MHLNTAEKYELWKALTQSNYTVDQAAERWGVDRSTVARIRKAAERGAILALADAEAAPQDGEEDHDGWRKAEQLANAVWDLTVELVLLRKKSRWG